MILFEKYTTHNIALQYVCFEVAQYVSRSTCIQANTLMTKSYNAELTSWSKARSDLKVQAKNLLRLHHAMRCIKWMIWLFSTYLLEYDRNQKHIFMQVVDGCVICGYKLLKVD